MRNRSLLQIYTFLAAALILAGCTTMKSTPSGFLHDYSNFEKSDEVKGRKIEVNPYRDISEYSKFMVAPVQVYFLPDANGVGVEPDKLKELTDYFHKELTTALEKKFEVVEEPGDDVLLIRAAITDVVANKPYFNLHWSTTLSGIGIGGATIEAECVDSMTGERILAMIDSRKGKQYRYTKGLTRWGHTKDILSRWSKDLAERLEDQEEDGQSKFAVVEAGQEEESTEQ